MDMQQTHDPYRAACEMAAGVLATVRMAHGLVAGDRAVDLTGLDGMTGVLCARALDLPPGQGRQIRAELMRLLAALDELAAALMPDPAGER